MAHHREPENVRAGYVYLVMASFGTLALLLAFGLLAGPDGGYAFDAIRAAPAVASARRARARFSLCSAPARRRASCRCMSGCRSPIRRRRATSPALMSGVMTKVAVYGFVRIVFDLLGAAGLVVEHGGARARRHHLRHGRALRADAARSEAAARLSHGREYRHHLHRARARARLPGQRHGARRPRSRSPRRCSTSSTIRCSRACCSSAPAPCSTRPASATWSISAG